MQRNVVPSPAPVWIAAGQRVVSNTRSGVTNVAILYVRAALKALPYASNNCRVISISLTPKEDRGKRSHHASSALCLVWSDMKNVRVAKDQPLTFECVRCCQQFMASGKSLKQMGAEVVNHIKERHPELSEEQTQKAA